MLGTGQHLRVSHCDYRDHNRTAVCTWSGFTLIPFSQDTTADNTLSKQPFVHAIKVDPNLAAPARLLNGTVTVQALAHGRVTMSTPSTAPTGCASSSLRRDRPMLWGVGPFPPPTIVPAAPGLPAPVPHLHPPQVTDPVVAAPGGAERAGWIGSALGPESCSHRYSNRPPPFSSLKNSAYGITPAPNSTSW